MVIQMRRMEDVDPVRSRGLRPVVLVSVALLVLMAGGLTWLVAARSGNTTSPTPSAKTISPAERTEVIDRLEADVTARARALARADRIRGPIYHTRCDLVRGWEAHQERRGIGRYSCTAFNYVDGPVKFGAPFVATVDFNKGRYRFKREQPKPGI